MTINYTLNIPSAFHDPGDDQPIMMDNNNAVNQIIGIDHVPFNVGSSPGQFSGQHKQVTFNGTYSQGPQVDPNSVIYTSHSTTTNVSELIFQNQNSPFPVGAIRAFGSFGTGVGPTFLNQYNCNPSIGASGNVYTINLNNNVVIGNNVCIIVSPSSNSFTTSYVFSNPTLTINAVLGLTINFLILQF